MAETVSSLVAQAGGAGGLLGMLPLIVGMFVIMYFLMIRPERKRQAEQQALLSSLKRGDEVVLTSGLFGKIQAVEERTITVEIADKTRVKVLKQAVMGPAQRWLAPAADAKKLDDKKDATGSPSGAPTAVPDAKSDDKSDDKSEKKSA